MTDNAPLDGPIEEDEANNSAAAAESGEEGVMVNAISFSAAAGVPNRDGFERQHIVPCNSGDLFDDIWSEDFLEYWPEDEEPMSVDHQPAGSFDVGQEVLPLPTKQVEMYINVHSRGGLAPPQQRPHHTNRPPQIRGHLSQRRACELRGTRALQEVTPLPRAP